MAKKTPDTLTTQPKPRKKRTSVAKHFIATIHGRPDPVLVIALTQRAAMEKIATIRAASPTDLLNAGKHGWAEIDLTPVAVAPKRDNVVSLLTEQAS